MGTLALAMTLTPVGTAYANATVPTEATTEMTVTTATEADSSTESTTEETTETGSNTEDATEATTTEDSSTEESTERSSTEAATNTENTTEDSEWPVDVLDADEDTTELDADMAGEIPVTAKYFPDATFREYVSENIDQDKNGVLSQDEINHASVYIIADINKPAIRSFKGIEYFKNMTSFYYTWDTWNSKKHSPLTSIDFSQNTKLTSVHLIGTSVKTLDFSHCPELTDIYCNDNQLTSLNISQNRKLNFLDCRNNKINALALVSPNLSVILCGSNKLKNLDISKLSKLKTLNCTSNELSRLNIGNNLNLTSLECGYNHLTTLDVTKNTKLTTLIIESNPLISINLKNNPELTKLNIQNCSLAYLDLNKNPKLTAYNIFCIMSSGNTCRVKFNTAGQFDLSTIPGFEISKVSNLKGGKIKGTILTLNKNSNKATYNYYCSSEFPKFEFSIQNESQLTPTEAFCSRLYTLCLNRSADPSGINYWSTLLQHRSITGAQVGYNFVFSDEYKKKKTSNEDFVKMLYLVFMDRSADKAGLNYWVDLLNQGVSREYVYKGFAESNEFQKICYSYGIMPGTISLKQARDQNINLTKFVSRIYAKAMNRKGDEAGLNYWCQQIQNKKMTPTQVAESFIYSKEFTDKKLSNTEYIKVLYRTFMGREADKSGLNYWVGRLNRGESRKTILKSFAGCPEFQKIVKSFGL